MLRAAHVKEVHVDGGERVAVCGIRLRGVESESLFRWRVMGSDRATTADVLHACRDRWASLADALAALREPLDFAMVFAAGSDGADRPSTLSAGFLAVGRGPSADERAKAARQGASTLHELLVSTLDYGRFEIASSETLLESLVGWRELRHGLELSRRVEEVQAFRGVLGPRAMGFQSGREANEGKSEESEAFSMPHLLPWVPSNDSWRRLLDGLLLHRATLVVTGRTFRRAPESAMSAAREQLTLAEQLLSTGAPPETPKRGTLLRSQAESLRAESWDRLAALESGALALRVGLLGSVELPAALVALLEGSLDDALEIEPGRNPRVFLRGGADLSRLNPNELLTGFDDPPLKLLFDAREAGGVLRTPLPMDVEIPGLPAEWSRTAPFVGRSSGDAPLGVNAHGIGRREVRLDEDVRRRHVYVVGQTGTGKSTLLAGMVLHDLKAGRGVAVLDPHGGLIDDILERFPEDRRDDLLLMDPTDAERPVGLNPFCLPIENEFEYRLARDLLIDEILAYLKRTYLAETMGPIFETQLRAMLGLLLGSRRPKAGQEPNLFLLRELYSNRALRSRLKDELSEQDFAIVQSVKEAEAVTDNDTRLNNMAPYITSKFTRFFSDTLLRNATCQPRTIDFASLLSSRGVLLLSLGKGRFGSAAAGMLASLVVGRLQQAAFARGPDQDGPPFCLYADEFQLLADERFAELLAEARKFGLALTLAHQYVDQLQEPVLRAVLGNVGTAVALRIGPRDAETLAPLVAPTFGKLDLVSLPDFRALARSCGSLGLRPFSLELEPLAAVEQAAARERREDLRAESRERHGTPRTQVENEILEVLTRHAALARNSD